MPERLEQPTYGPQIDQFRQTLTQWMIGLYAFSLTGDLVLGLVAKHFSLDLTPVRDPLHDANVAITGILGVVIGFYFGEKRR